MGFVGDVVRDVIDTVGTLAYVGGSIIANGITDFFSGSSSNDYQPSASITAEHSKSNADILAELKADIRDEAEKKEKQIIDYINKSLNKLLMELEKINRQNFWGKTLNINIEEIKNKNNALEQEVVGFIGNYMEERLVPSDHELSNILEILDDRKRKNKFDAFCKDLQKQAVEKLKAKIETTVHKQKEIIRQEIQNRLTEIDKSMQGAERAYEEILQMKKEQDAAGIEEKQIQYCYQYELSEILLEQLES